MFDLKTGLENLKRYIKVAPESAGVYRMISINDEVLYVGKAKNIKKRIVSYSHIEKLSKRLQQMVAQIDKMEFIAVDCIFISVNGRTLFLCGFCVFSSGLEMEAESVLLCCLRKAFNKYDAISK